MTSLAAGFKRNANWFWKQRLKMNPEIFSPNNVYRISVLELSPEIDDTWVKYNKPQLGQIYFDDKTGTYVLANRMAEWDEPATSGPHKNWKRVAWVSQYTDYAWDIELHK